MLFLLDTNAVSDLMFDDPGVIGRLARIKSEDRLAICTIVRGEILYGLERLPDGKRRAELGVRALDVLKGFHCEAITTEIADHYARIKASTARRGQSLDDNDLWIAASARSLGAVLVTRDQDFGRIEGLAVENWGE